MARRKNYYIRVPYYIVYTIKYIIYSINSTYAHASKLYELEK